MYRSLCECEAQFTKPECRFHFVKNSTHIDIYDPLSETPSPSLCPPATSPTLYYLPITSYPVSMATLNSLASCFYSTESHPKQKLVPVIFHLGISFSFSWPQTVEIMNSVSAVLEEATPRTKYRPVLWMNPAASGHLKPPGAILEQGNEAILAFSMEMESQAGRKGWEMLGMWNATVQAESWDGSNYGKLTISSLYINY